MKLKIESLGEDAYHIFTHIKLNGKKCRALIDTGASKSVIAAKVLKKYNLKKPLEVEGQASGGIGSEALELQYFVIKRLKLGKLKIKKLIVGCSDLSHIDAMYDQIGLKPFDFIIGGDILNQLHAVIDYKNAKVNFSKK